MRVAISLFLVTGAIFWAPLIMAQEPAVHFVEVRATKLRAVPQHWGSAVGELTYGDKLTELGRQGGWIEVQDARGARGFVHATAVTARRVVLPGKGEGAGPGAGQGADASDIVLAGKGFNKEVEARYAADDKALNYAAVDLVEGYRVTESDLASFLKTGGLHDRG